MSREELLVDFLQSNKMGAAKRSPLSQDASFRRYERLYLDGKSFMLMDAPPPQEDVNPFINIANYLRRRGFSSPEIYAEDTKNGFLLLEDLGDNSYTKVLSGNSPLSGDYDELELYSAAVDVLIQLGRSTLPRKMPGYNDELLLKESNLLLNWYIPHTNPDVVNDELREHYKAIWNNLLVLKKVTDDVLVLRDYHADNLMWLPDRLGVLQVGVLDFQDAVIGSPIYDLVSLLEDARRDISKEVVQKSIDRYLGTRKTINREDFSAAYAILAAQRNCKIIGIFARLAVRDGKPHYLNYLPRVWKHLEHDLKHPVLADLKTLIDKAIPPEKRLVGSFILPSKECEIV